MQCADEHVLAVLDRTHTPGRPEAASPRPGRPGFEHVNLDLIYGTPGESDADWRASLDAALGRGPGPRLGVRADRRGGHPAGPPDPPRRGADARRRRARRPLPDRRRGAARGGFDWYEVSNWATSTAARCRHNGCTGAAPTGGAPGPGAHSHVGGVRWWNVKHPGAYAGRWRRGGRRRAGGRCSRTRTGGWSGCCWSCGWPRACRCRCCATAGRRRRAGAGGRAAGGGALCGGAGRADAARPAAGRRGGPRPGGLTVHPLTSGLPRDHQGQAARTAHSYPASPSFVLKRWSCRQARRSQRAR